jgi:hypothetical protein
VELSFEIERKKLMKVMSTIKKATADTQKRGKQALHLEAEYILDEALAQTPIEWGPLKESGEVVDKGPFQVAIKFGGAAREYAIYVHENKNARHYPPYGKGGKAKFLEDPFVEAIYGMADRIVSFVKKGKWF